MASTDYDRRGVVAAADPSLNASAARAAAVRIRNAGRFRRQRPAFAEVPRRLAPSVPVHDVGADAADEFVMSKRPAVTTHSSIPSIHEREIRAKWIGDEPY